MSSSVVRAAERSEMTLREFRRFQLERPDDERWELIEGAPFMMTPPFIAHNLIAGNLQSLLNGAMQATRIGRVAVQRVGVDLGIEGELLRRLGKAARYAPEPDLAVIKQYPDSDRRYADCVFVFVEVVSSTDDERELASGLRWIEAKTKLYRAHTHCEAIVVVERDRIEVRSSVQHETGWRDLVLTGADDTFALPTCGLACKVGELYAGTHLDPQYTRNAGE